MRGARLTRSTPVGPSDSVSPRRARGELRKRELDPVDDALVIIEVSLRAPAPCDRGCGMPDEIGNLHNQALASERTAVQALKQLSDDISRSELQQLREQYEQPTLDCGSTGVAFIRFKPVRPQKYPSESA